MFPDMVERMVYTSDEISRRVSELGAEITTDLEQPPGDALAVVSILKGSFIFLADLIRNIGLELTVDFMAISSYPESDASSGGVRIIKDLSESIYGREVLLVEDIIDTGLTLSYILRNLKGRSPRSVRVCTLLDRTVSRIAPIHVDYSGFEIGEEFLVGYGLDHLQRWRNLPFICTLKDTGPAP